MNINLFSAFSAFHAQDINRPSAFRTAQPQTQTQIQAVKSDRTLQGIARKVLDTYESENRASRVKSQAIELANYVSAGLDDEMSEKLPKDVLMQYLGEFNFTKRIAANTIHWMSEIKDGLNACDQAAADYQDMLDGKTDIPEDLTRDDVEKLLDITQKQRDKYLRAGNYILKDLDYFNVFAEGGSFSRTVKDTFGENPFAGIDTETWLDTSLSTEDLLAQIDDVIGCLSGAVDVLDEGIHLIAKELDRQNLLDEKIKKYIQMLSGGIDSSCYASRPLSYIIDRIDSEDRYNEVMRTGNYIDHGDHIEYSVYG